MHAEKYQSIKLLSLNISIHKKNARMRAVEAEYKCRLHLTLTDPQTEPGVSREATPLKNSRFSSIHKIFARKKDLFCAYQLAKKI